MIKLLNKLSIREGLLFLTFVLVLYFLNAIRYTYENVNLYLVLFIFSSLVLIFKYLKNINIFKISVFLFLFYFITGYFLEVIPFSDFGSFYYSAIKFSNNFDMKYLYDSKSPVTTIYYSISVLIFGKSLIAFYIGIAIAWALQVPILYKSLINLNIKARNAKIIAIVYGFNPSLFYFSSVVSTESIFMLLLIVNFYLTTKILNKSQNLYNYALLGIVFSLFYLTRGNAIVFIFVSFFTILYFHRKELFKIIILIIFSLLILSCQVFLNYKYENKISISTSPWAPYLLMTGTNFKSNGGYSKDDLKLAGFIGENKTSMLDARKNALVIAKERILSNPLLFIKFSLTNKVQRLWETETSNIGWAMNKSPKKHTLRDEIYISKYILNAFLFLLIFGSILYLLMIVLNNRNCEKKEETNVLIFLTVPPLLLLAFLHLFIEVQPRYHWPFIPYMIIFTVLFIDKLLINKVNIENAKEYILVLKNLFLLLSGLAIFYLLFNLLPKDYTVVNMTNWDKLKCNNGISKDICKKGLIHKGLNDDSKLRKHLPLYLSQHYYYNSLIMQLPRYPKKNDFVTNTQEFKVDKTKLYTFSTYIMSPYFRGENKKGFFDVNILVNGVKAYTQHIANSKGYKYIKLENLKPNKDGKIVISLKIVSNVDYGTASWQKASKVYFKFGSLRENKKDQKKD